MNICVFGASSENIDKAYLTSAQHLGSTLAQRGDAVIFGAGKYGVMGAVARGVASEGGRLIGVVPSFFLESNVIFEQSSETVLTETMRERKAIMEDRADAFVICAGGIGTFEEFFEVITLKQLGRHAKPIIIYNVNGYYDSMLAMLQNAVDEGFMTDDSHKLYTVAQTEEEIFAQLEDYKPYQYNKYNFLDEEE
jgi:hypothetical protein